MREVVSTFILLRIAWERTEKEKAKKEREKVEERKRKNTEGIRGRKERKEH